MNKSSSWKTSTASISGLVVLVAATLKQLTDGDVNTNPDWNIVVPLFITSLTGIFARDNDKSSEQVGADKN